MESAAFIRAILAEPEDDAPRLIFADWLEEHGQEARANWIRVSCRLAATRSSAPNFRELIGLQYHCFQRCRPQYWQYISGVIEHNVRGMFRFQIRSKTAAARLGKVPWLGDAATEGWLEGVTITWCDGSLAQVIAKKWTGGARELPLFVHPAPQIPDEGLAFYVDEAPHVWELDVPTHAMRNPSIWRLGRRSGLRRLRLEGMPDDERVAALFEQIGRLRGLRRLAVSGRTRPNDADLKPLGELNALRELDLAGCVALTDAGLAPLRRLTGLRRLRLSVRTGVTEAGLAELRQALPTVRVGAEPAAFGVHRRIGGVV